MQISVVLHSYLRDKVPKDAKGKVELTLPEGAQIQDVIDRFDIPPEIVFAVNDQLCRDRARTLSDGDVVRFFRQGSGGAR